MRAPSVGVRDHRWPAIAARLAELRSRGRHAVRIVDAQCGAGTLLVQAARHARALGFTAIEACGIDRSPALIGRARAAAMRLRDPAIGFGFEAAAAPVGFVDDDGEPADILLCHAPPPAAVARDARAIIADPAPTALAA